VVVGAKAPPLPRATTGQQGQQRAHSAPHRCALSCVSASV